MSPAAGQAPRRPLTGVFPVPSGAPAPLRLNARNLIVAKRKRRKEPRPPGEPVSPTSAEVTAHIKHVAKTYPDLVKVRRAGASGEGRPIWAVTVSDTEVPDADKQHALFIAGRHGNEESGRMLALALLDWLVTTAGRKTLKHQKIVIMPDCNPDAAARDTHWTLAGVNVGTDMYDSNPVGESRALRSVVDALQPELLCDLHSRGGCGCSYDMVLFCATKSWTEDDGLFHEIARDMARAAEKAGIPNRVHPLSWWTDPAEGVWDQIYRKYKTIGMLTETSEHNEMAYPAKDRVRSGLAKLKALLAWGNRRHPQLYYPGYPVNPVGGMFTAGLVALGKTAARRRKSRVALWRYIRRFPKVDYDIPEKPREKTVRMEYTGPRIRTGVGVQTRTRGRLNVREVRLDGRKLKPSETSGYYTWHDECSTFLVACIGDLKRGNHTVEIAYK